MKQKRKTLGFQKTGELDSVKLCFFSSLDTVDLSLFGYFKKVHEKMLHIANY